MTAAAPVRAGRGAATLADPAARYWTYADLCAVFGLAERRLRLRLVEWEADGFPAPRPWLQRPKTWDPGSVLRWKARQERRCRAVPVELVAIEGGRT